MSLAGKQINGQGTNDIAAGSAGQMCVLAKAWACPGGCPVSVGSSINTDTQAGTDLTWLPQSLHAAARTAIYAPSAGRKSPTIRAHLSAGPAG